LQLAALGIRHRAVDRRGMNQERRSGNAKIMVAQAAGLLFTARKIGDEVLDGVEQGQSPERQCLSPGEIFRHGPERRNRPRAG